MAIANCARCGKLYQKPAGVKICAECVQSEEDAYRLVRDHLEANPGIELPALSAATGVDESQIERFVRQGRLAMLEEHAEGLVVECQRCGAPITSGRHCAACTEAIAQELKASVETLRDRQLGGRPDPLREKRARDSSSWRQGR
ncbi:MAG TPA: hypothetical protein V6D47_11670 [Oscillatoriaceae cyanobacterium]